MKYKAYLLAIELSGALVQAVPACSPSQNIDIEFSKNRADLTGEDVRRLAAFSIEIKQRYPQHDFLEISGLAAQDEKNPDALAKQRALAVQQYFQRTQYHKAPIEMSSLVIKNQQKHLIKNPSRTEVMFMPAPPHDCSSSALATPR